jgi:hypothetical protein
MTAADPRIFPLKLVRVVASYGRVLPACSVGSIYLEDGLIGSWTSSRAARHLTELSRRLEDEKDNDDSFRKSVKNLLKREKKLVGFGVPFRNTDERVEAVRRRLKKTGRCDLHFWRIMERFAEVIREESGLEPNIGIAAAAVCLDLGFRPRNIGALVTALVQHTILANAIESAHHPNCEFQCIETEKIRYEGRPERISPRFAKKSGDDRIV